MIHFKQTPKLICVTVFTSNIGTNNANSRLYKNRGYIEKCKLTILKADN